MKQLPRIFQDIIETIEEGLNKGRPIPTLILIYSSIDSISHLTDTTDKRGRSVFKNWVKEWMLKKYPLPCNETEIYSARCGLLHQHSGESDITKSGEGKQVWYTHGQADVNILQATIIHIGQDKNALAVRLEDLIYSFKNGLIDCLTAVEKDKQWMSSFESRSLKTFGTIPSKL